MTTPDEFGGAPYGSDDPARRALPPRPSRAPLVVASVAGVLALGAVGVFVVPRLLPPPSASAPLSPEQTVSGFFDALTSADAAAALAFVGTPPADATFLTDDVLRAMADAHPITAVSPRLAGATDDTATVAVTYSVDDEPVATEFGLRFAEGRWRLDPGTSQVDLGEVVGPSAGLRLYGVDAGDRIEVALFPGVYDVTTGNSLLTLGAKTLSVPGPDTRDAGDIEVRLSRQAVTRIRDAARQKLSACTAPGKVPADSCGIAPGKPEHGEIAPKSIEWEVVSGSDNLGSISPTLQPGNQLATAPIAISLNLSAESTDGKLHYLSARTITAVQADISDPENIQISFSAA